jgi:hypothetical protein
MKPEQEEQPKLFISSPLLFNISHMAVFFDLEAMTSTTEAPSKPTFGRSFYPECKETGFVTRCWRADEEADSTLLACQLERLPLSAAVDSDAKGGPCPTMWRWAWSQHPFG